MTGWLRPVNSRVSLNSVREHGWGFSVIIALTRFKVVTSQIDIQGTCMKPLDSAVSRASNTLEDLK